MRTLPFALVALASAQNPGLFMAKDAYRLRVESTLRAEPPSSTLARKFVILAPREKSVPNWPVFYSRIVLDNANRLYFGYELLIEQQQPGDYLATFSKLGVTPLDLAGSGNLKLSINPDGSTNLNWTLLPLPEIPKPRVIHDGDPLSLEIFIDPATGEKLIDDIRILPPRPPGTHFVPVPLAAPNPPPVPTVSGKARDFSAADADLQIVVPRTVTLNGARQGSVALRNARGPLVWLYLPDRGRYVFSLTPRSDLDFRKAGEVRGGAIIFAMDGDAITLECTNAIASGDAAYTLYVLHDEDWEPIAEAQKLHPGIGSVSAGELSALKQK